jgi:hypothetical protein
MASDGLTTAHTTTLSAGLTIPVLTPRTNEINITISGRITMAAGLANEVVSIRDNATVAQWLFPFEEADLVAATLTANIAPASGAFFIAGFCRDGATASADNAEKMIYKTEGYTANYTGIQHVVSLPLNHNYGRKIKGTNLGNPAPAIMLHASHGTTTTAYTVGRYSLNIVMAPSGISV